jgi:hypothetical protein
VPGYLSGQNLSGHDLSEADLRHANLSGHDLSGADLSGTDLRHANLSGANLSGAILSGADLRHANLSGANLSRADLSGAILSGASGRDTLWPEGFSPETISAGVQEVPETTSVGVQEAPRFAVMIEGRVYAWERKTISVSEIRSLGDLPEDRAVVEMEMAGGEDYGPVWERPLKEDEVHELVPLEPGVVTNIEFRRG